MTDLNALVLSCSLKPSPAASSSELLGRQILDELGSHGVTGEVVRVVDHDVRFGVSTDEGDVIAIRPIMNMVLGVDHRANDGAGGAALLRDIKAWLEGVGPDTAIY